MKSDRTLIILGAVLLALVLAGPLLPQWAMFLVTIAIAKGLVALALMLQLRAGLVSFGQALYYCVGAYTAGSLGRFFGISDMLLQMITGAAVAAFVAFVLGFLLARYRGIFYGLLSLALSMILYGLLVKSEALGSTDGINILPSTVFGIRPAQESVRHVVLVTGCAVAFLATLLVNRYLNTPPVCGPHRPLCEAIDSHAGDLGYLTWAIDLIQKVRTIDRINLDTGKKAVNSPMAFFSTTNWHI